MHLDYQLVGSGWASATVTHLDQSAELGASYLTNALGDLVAGAVLAISSEVEIRFSWELEPGEHRWILTPVDGQLRIRILAFNDFWSASDDDDGREAFSCKVPAVDFARPVAEAASRVYLQWGAEGYRERWVQHEFPAAQLEELEHLVASAG